MSKLGRPSTLEAANLVVSKCGLHSINTSHPGYGTLLQTVNAAGRKLSLVKCRDNFGPAFEAAQLWPDVLTIGAQTAYDGFPFDYAKFKTTALLNPHIKYWEVFNEQNGVWVEQADLYISLLPQFAADGLRLCAFNCASGTPQYPHIDPLPYQQIKRVCDFAKERGYDMLLGLHEYGTGADLIGRYKVLADYLGASCPPIVITEYGKIEAGNITPAELLPYIANNDQADMRDPRLLGRALWTMGGWVNIEASFVELADYLATVAPVEPVPTDREFDHWLDLDTGETFADNPYSFSMPARNVRLEAISRPKPPTLYTCQISSDDPGIAVTGGGTFKAGDTVTAFASEA